MEVRLGRVAGNPFFSEEDSSRPFLAPADLEEGYGPTIRETRSGSAESRASLGSESEAQKGQWERGGRYRVVSCLRGTASYFKNAARGVAGACFGSWSAFATTAVTATLFAFRIPDYNSKANVFLNMGVGAGIRLLMPTEGNPTVRSVAMTLLGMTSIEYAAQVYLNVTPLLLQAIGWSVPVGILGACAVDIILDLYQNRSRHIDGGNGPEPSQTYFKGVSLCRPLVDFLSQTAVGAASLIGSFTVNSALLQRVCGFFGFYCPSHMLGELSALYFDKKSRELDNQLPSPPEGIRGKITEMMKSVQRSLKTGVIWGSPLGNAISFIAIGILGKVWGFRGMAIVAGYCNGVVRRSFIERWRTKPIKDLSEFTSGGRSSSLSFRIFRVAWPLLFVAASLTFAIWQWKTNMGEPDHDKHGKSNYEKIVEAKVELATALAGLLLMLPLYGIQASWNREERLKKTLPEGANFFNNSSCRHDYWMRWSQDPHVLSVSWSIFYFVITAAVNLGTSEVSLDPMDRLVRCLGLFSLGGGIAIETIKWLGPMLGLGSLATHMAFSAGAVTIPDHW